MSRKVTEQQRPPQRLYDLKAAATYLGRTVWGVRELIWAGQLPVVRSGKKIFIDIIDLDAYIEKNKSYEHTPVDRPVPPWYNSNGE